MNWRAPESRTQSWPKRAMGAAKRETSRRALFPGASELSRVAAHPVSVSLSVNVAAAHDVPGDPGSHQHGRLDVLDRPRGSARGTAPVAAPRSATPPPTTSAAPSNDRSHGHHVRYWDTSLIRRHASARGSGSSYRCTVVMVPWIALAGPVPASSALTPRRTCRCAAAGGRSGPPGSPDLRRALMMARGVSSCSMNSSTAATAAATWGSSKCTVSIGERRRSSAVPARSPRAAFSQANGVSRRNHRAGRGR